MNFNYTEDDLNEFPEEIEWEPVFLSDVEFCLINRLCNGGNVCIDDSDFLAFLAENNVELNQIIDHLNSERLIYVEGNQIFLLTEQCVCAATPYGLCAGENKDNRMINWMMKHSNKT